MKFLKGLRGRMKGIHYFPIEVGPELSLSERLEKIYKDVGIAHKRIDELLFLHSGATQRALSLYEELIESKEGVSFLDDRFPRTTEEYEKVEKFYEKFETLKKELSLFVPKETLANLSLYNTFSKYAKIKTSSSRSLPEFIKNQGGIEIVDTYIFSPSESIKIYEVAGRRPTFGELSKTLEELGLNLKKVTEKDNLGKYMSLFLFPFYKTEEGILKGSPYAYTEAANPPTIYLCKGSRGYAERGLLAFLESLKPLHDQTICEYIYTQNFPVYMYETEGKLIEKIGDLYLKSDFHGSSKRKKSSQVPRASQLRLRLAQEA